MTNKSDLSAQKREEKIFVIPPKANCAEALELFKTHFNVLLAYNPALSSVPSIGQKTLRAKTYAELFAKLCLSFSLEYIIHQDDTYLVRSNFDDIVASDSYVMHINIIDELSGKPIEFATVYDPSKKYFGFTDEYGDCFIRMPKQLKGTKLFVHSLAHYDKEVSIPNDALFKNVKLSADPIKIIPVTISSIKRKLSFIKQQGIFIDSAMIQQLSNSSVFNNDVLRTVQMLPGINNTNDASASVRIRGANEEATLLMLDNMPIYKADHFYGIFGTFNSFYVNDYTLFKNNIPVEYGGRISGMLRMNSSSNATKPQLKLDANLLNTSLMADIPLSKHLLWKMAGRTTYTDLVKTELYDLSQRERLASDPKSQSLIVSRPSFNFKDFNTRLVFNKGKHSLDFNSFLSGDLFKDQYNISFKIKQNTINEEFFKQETTWNNQAFGVNYSFTGDAIVFKSNIYATEFKSAYNINSTLTRKEPGGLVRDSVAILNQNKIEDLGGKASVKVNAWKGLELGVEHIIHNNALLIENDVNTIFEINKSASISSMFATMDFGHKTKLYFVPALRSSYVHFLNKAYVLPQFYLSYALSSSSTVKASAGRHLQVVRLFEHENPLGQRQQFFALSNGKNIPVGIGQNYMIGSWWSSGLWTLDFEAYFRWMDGAITHATNIPGLRLPSNMVSPSSFRLFTGESKVKGADFSLIYDNESVFSMLTYTLSQSVNRFVGIFNQQFFAAPEDSRHQIKFFNAFTWRNLSFSLNYVGATGRPYLDLSGLDNKVDRRNLDLDKYIKTLRNYHRIDFGLQYKFKLAGQGSKIGFSVFNVLDRANVKYLQFVHQLPPLPGSQNTQNTVLGSEVTQLGRTFNVSFSLEIK
ncbi:MAG: hypothetical protein IPN86_23650 [Saprospiraceae bacterium]|nr:hypothetical protein [Saprospiraceae bacterium]